jgi:hypothetical protein
MLEAGDMSRPAPQILLSTEEKETLLRGMRSSKSAQRMVQRARVILLAASGMNGKQIALKMQTLAARVSKWLRRFARDRIAALNDNPRSGTKRRKYTSATEERSLKALDHELVRRLLSIFLKDTSGRRPVHGQTDVYAKNPTWQNLILF